MASETCTVDVEPQSLFGVTCGRLIRNGECPDHGTETNPSVFDRVEPTGEQIAQTLEALAGLLGSGR